jgi:hypothetical protein
LIVRTACTIVSQLNIMVRLKPGLSVQAGSAALRAVQPQIRAGAMPVDPRRLAQPARARAWRVGGVGAASTLRATAPGHIRCRDSRPPGGMRQYRQPAVCPKHRATVRAERPDRARGLTTISHSVASPEPIRHRVSMWVDHSTDIDIYRLNVMYEIRPLGASLIVLRRYLSIAASMSAAVCSSHS